MATNQTRILAQVLALDAWHKPLRTDGGVSPVHVDLSFHEGRIGGDDQEVPLTFRIRLKRALLSVRLEPPLELDRESVARGIPAIEAEHKRVLALQEQAKQNSSVKGRISPSALHLAAGGAVTAESEVTKEEELRIIQKVPKIIATPKPRGAGEYAWELKPGHDETLDGVPWDPVAEPRLSVKSLLARSAIDPTIKVIVSCKFEDIEVSDFRPKDESLIGKLKEAVFPSDNLAVAAQQIKLTLRDADLAFGSLDDKFSELMLADVLAVEQ